ncbi:MAG: hypothetical protein IPN17_20980 [Deltaproteobacteria bacterium]|nr:hypothetical protein [Deltaproteobacteria bacterium]MBK8694680.1 hypothetical protein [Deltaproteobacteria bacterium]
MLGMNPEEVTRTLAMFDAFLSYARAASVPATAVAAHPPLTDVETAVTAVRGSNAAPGSTDDAPSDGDVTRVTAAPPPSAPSGQAWEEPTNERPEVMRALARSDAAQPDTDVSIPLPRPPAADPRVEQASIIIEDDSLTEPEFRREDVLRAMAEHARPRPEEVPAPVATPSQPAPPPPPMAAEDFAAEMLVLVKYGHAAQAVGEVDRWVKAYPEHTNALAPVALSVSRAASRAARRG